MKAKNRNGMWQYLHDSGVLENGSDAEIKAAKRKYRQLYLSEWKRHKRSTHPEFTVSLNQDESQLISEYAERHGISRTAYIKAAALAYSSKSFIIPNRDQLARIEQTLAKIYNTIQMISESHGSSLFTRERDFIKLKKAIENLEVKMSDSLRKPHTLNEIVLKAISNDPDNRKKLLSLLHSI